MKRIYIYLVFALLISCQSFDKLEYSHYNFSVEIDPESESLQAKLDFQYLHQGAKTDTLSFYLHKNLIIESLDSPKLSSWSVDSCYVRFMPEANKITLIYNESIDLGDVIYIDLNYAGEIGIVEPWQTNRITADWVELGLYSPWFLYSPEISRLTFEGSLKIDDDYTIASNAEITQKEGFVYLKADSPRNDINISASKTMKSLCKSSNDCQISFLYDSLKDSIALDIVEKSLLCMNTYQQWFGAAPIMKNTIVSAPREKGGGYARIGFISLSQINDASYAINERGYLRYFAHEISHLWWNRADASSWEDWLNESFAEFSAMMIIREIYGEEEFQKRIDRKKKKIKGLPPIYNIGRSHEKAYSVLYDKACVVLSEFELEIGKDNFKKLLYEIYSENITLTKNILELIEKEFGKDASDKLCFLLKK